MSDCDFYDDAPSTAPPAPPPSLHSFRDLRNKCLRNRPPVGTRCPIFGQGASSVSDSLPIINESLCSNNQDKAQDGRPEWVSCPPVNHGPKLKRIVCGNHPRDDCCRVPCAPLQPIQTMTGSDCCTSKQWQCEPIHCIDLIRPAKPQDRYEPPAEPFKGNSSYRTHFQGCFGLPARSFKPETNTGMADSPMASATVYRQDFDWKCCAKRDQIRGREEYTPANSPFQGCSTYRQDFRGIFIAPAESSKPEAVTGFSNAKMDGCTSYRCDFIPYCSAEQNYARGTPLKPTQQSGFSCQPFNGCSTYRMDFVPKYCCKARSAKPENIAGFSSSCFGGRSTYRNDYLPFCFNVKYPQNQNDVCCIPASYC